MISVTAPAPWPAAAATGRRHGKKLEALEQWYYEWRKRTAGAAFTRAHVPGGAAPSNEQALDHGKPMSYQSSE